jgi:6-pyruvoyl-tetrahydropterin synthase
MSYSSHLSKIFINSLTVLDCAVWDLKLGPIGRSWNVDVEWTGSTNHEGVVLDFSAAKKLAKSVIDIHFDHRLFISEKQVRQELDGRFTCFPSIETPFSDRFLMETYADSLVIFKHGIMRDVTEDSIQSLEETLAIKILESSPENVTNVRIRLREHTQRDESFYFNYLHSLRLHQGNCQRFHGHSNIIEVFENGDFSTVKSAAAAEYLKGKYLVAESYVELPPSESSARIETAVKTAELDTDAFCWISYEGSQGPVQLRVPNAKLITMTDESSIENISVWVHKHLFNDDPKITVYAYEGLNKGAICP